MPTMSSAWPVNVVPEHRRDADRVLVDVRLDVLGADRVLVVLQRDDPRLDVEVAAELLPHDVHVAAEDEVRPVGGLARRLAARAPLPLQRQRAEHDRLRRALRARAGRLARRVEQVGEHPDAALLDLRRLRVLGVVDEVAVQVLGDDALRLGLHPRRHERGEVAHRDARRARAPRRSAASHRRRACRARAARCRARLEQEPVAVLPRRARRALDARRAWCGVVQGHVGTSWDRTGWWERPQQDGADEEARGAERGGPVGGGEVEDRPRRGHDVGRDRGDHEEHAAGEVDRRPLPPPALVRRRGPRRGRRATPETRKHADPKRSGAQTSRFSWCDGQPGLHGVERVDVEQERADELHGRAPPGRRPRRTARPRRSVASPQLDRARRT